ncbi:hypothetical protein FB451DRAFT_131577 [Mycena latifolia]|nr:hypothetical protein FB451DRAFT_131577 [Mycena latifolia]
MAIIYMYRWMVLLLVWAVFSPIGARAAFIVDDFTKPALTCAPFLIQWQGGTAPWTLRYVHVPLNGSRLISLSYPSILQASDSAVLEDLGTFKVTSFNWNVDLTAGTSVLVQIQDATGAIAISKVLTVQAGSTDCALTTVGNPQTSTSTRETTATQAATTTKQTTTAKPPPPPPPGTTSSTAAYV